MRKSSSIALSTTSPPSSTAYVDLRCLKLVPSLEWIRTRPLAVLRVFTRCFSSPLSSSVLKHVVLLGVSHQA
eukprot:2872434-Prymnesium_polylepis.1